MIREKAERLFRRFRRNLRPTLLLWLPAAIVFLFLGIVFFSVIFSTDASFRACSRQLPVCVGETPGFAKVLTCSYQTAWCDVKAVWDKARGKTADVAPSDLPGLPPVDEKAEKELFEKLTSDEFLEKRFEELEREERDDSSGLDDLPEKEDLKGYMEELRSDRVSFEKEMAEKREKMLQNISDGDVGDNILSGQTEK